MPSSQGDSEGIHVLAQKQNLVDVLRSRGQSQRADWVQRDLPDEFETDRHRGLLDMLRVTLADLVGIADDSARDSAEAEG
jgi:hypothetical protein